MKKRSDETVKGQNVVHHWNLSVKFIDKIKSRKIPGKAKVYYDGGNRFRMDVYDPFGLMQVGSLVLNNGQMVADFINEKKYKGPIDRKKIKELLKVDVAPEDLFSLFTQVGFEDKHWECSVDERNLLKACHSGMNRVDIEWSGSMTQTGTNLLVDHRKAQLKFSVRSYKQVESSGEKVFAL